MIQSTVLTGTSRSRLGWIALIVLAVVLLWLLVRCLGSPVALPLYDYVEYWSAGRLAVTGGNPYSPEQLLELQKQVGWQESRPLMMWNPPWTLTLVIPFACLDFAQGHIVWLLGLLVVLAWCVHRIWRVYNADDRRLWLAALVGITFMPVIVTMAMSQITPLVLLGFGGFLHFAERRRYFWAGALAALVAVKPHLAHLFWIGLLLWSIDRRRWPALAGLSAALACLSIVPVLLDPLVFLHYIEALHDHPPQHWVMPTLGTLLRQWFGWEYFWLQFVPPVLGGVWFMAYWWRNRRDWSWPERLPLIVIVSCLTSPYGAWTVDMVVFLIPVLALACAASRRGVRASLLFLALYAVIDGLALWQKLSRSHEFEFLWLAPALLAVYLISGSVLASAGKYADAVLE